VIALGSMLQKNIHRYYSLLFLLFLLSTPACKKESTVQVDFKTFEVGQSITLRGIDCFSDSVWYTCGGKKADFGLLFRSVDAGATWTQIFKVAGEGRTIFDVQFFSAEEGWAVGDSLMLLKTGDGGASWKRFWFGNKVPDREDQRISFRQIFHESHLKENNRYIVGGDNFDTGVWYGTADGGNLWRFRFFENEIRGIHFFDKVSGYMAAYGGLIETTNYGKSFHYEDLTNEYFVSVEFLLKSDIAGEVTQNIGVAVSYNGAVYRTTDKGKSWERVFNTAAVFGANRQFNRVRFAKTDNISDDLGYIIGNNGLVMRTTDAGENWDRIEGLPDLNFTDIDFTLQGDALITAEKGKIVKISRPD